ncbi:poly [ADP-ribose] polymerase 2/3/4 [Microdochium nivale]|nr:poly [ADP-ribose] polymerase 2/3/4 [Microdochium nivale]
MEQRWLPDAQGTINPAKLLPGAMPPPTLLTPPLTPEATLDGLGTFAHCDIDIAPASHDGSSPYPASEQATANAPYRRHTPRRSRLPRISSDVDIVPTSSCNAPAEDTAQGMKLWLGFDQSCGRCVDAHLIQKAPSGLSASAMHKNYFDRQVGRGSNILCALDPEAGPECRVSVESSTRTIWDAYLLRADVARNVNSFRRQQITYDKFAKTYSLWVRDGSVGQLGQLTTNSRLVLSCSVLKLVSTRFKSLFRSATGQTWERRYYGRQGRPLAQQFEFVELDYARDSCQPELPEYTDLNATVVGEVKTLMDLMLHGRTDQSPTTTTPQCQNYISKTQFPWCSYTAPYKQLSHYAIFLGFQTLTHIQSLLESSDGSLKWKTMQRQTSRYRSQIPYCQAPSSAYFSPVISSHQALFLELRLLSSLWPQQRDIARAMLAACDRATLHWQAHGVLAQPLYQAYSSLRHGFRRLTDRASAEYRDLCGYLLGSNHAVHRMRFEVQDIYRVFVKAGLTNDYKDWIESGRGVDKSSSGGGGDDGTQGDAEERLLLWHGTPLDSLLGILDLGLQIRRRGANFTGTMFGNGIYLADSSSKSASFCRHHQNLNSSQTPAAAGPPPRGQQLRAGDEEAGRRPRAPMRSCSCARLTSGRTGSRASRAYRLATTSSTPRAAGRGASRGWARTRRPPGRAQAGRSRPPLLPGLGRC